MRATPGQIRSRALLSPALPSLMTSRGRPRCRAAKSSSIICQAAPVSAPAMVSASKTFSPLSFTPKATSTGSETTLPPLRTLG
jgi:hypothetical protein